eukprot:CAMPEP_0206625494 /NCGR_PEP_ID=MMETSP0325_2-20121206/64779_1 /ASSEMBLY_ACC=CAM_ASM_000347 /TAXON_ID=2866 /ORGANISM="Crypthecodinium cohnii, Strain Seligo" /LENGTH=100 /DNA_ID=CAMNT_0054149709 /DNA_START=643 /DNA_END=945 /DNA_ORIENTATION=+
MGKTKLSSRPITSANTSPTVTTPAVVAATPVGRPAYAPNAEQTLKHAMLPSTFRLLLPTGMLPAAVPKEDAASPMERKRTPKTAKFRSADIMAASAPGKK